MGIDPGADFFASCPRLFFTATSAGAFVRLSGALARLLGQGVEAGTKFTDRVHPEDRSVFEAGWAKLTEGEGAVRIEFRLREAGDSYRPVRCDAQRSHDTGDVHGAIEHAQVDASVELLEMRDIERELMDKIELVERQHRAIRALGTPIIEVWDKVLTLPMMGVVDSSRAAEVMSSLLAEVSQKGARFAILDLTGVEAVDTMTAGHLIKLIQALRLLGAEGIITGIKPDVAQTMVTLGMNLNDIVTLAKLRDGLKLCMRRSREGAA